MRTLTGLEAIRNILDPIHGSIPITPIENKVISTPLFQRLRKVTQLSQGPLVFPGATHNRFQHSLGTMYIMDKLLNTLEQKGKLPDKEKKYKKVVQSMRLAALLHDSGHLPFSHTFENEYKEENINHEFFSRYMITKSLLRDVLINNGYNPESIASIIEGQPLITDPNFRNFLLLYPLLSSEFDADRMDYLLRDSYFTGVPYGKFDLDRICNMITLEDELICFNEKAQTAVEDFLFSRYQMYRIVYIHKTVICYELILHKIYNEYFKKYKDQVDFPFFLPSINDFENSSFNWYNNIFCKLSESDFFKSIEKLLESNTLRSRDEKTLTKLYRRITFRIPIKNCFKFDDITETTTAEYADKELELYSQLKNYPRIVNHWSFLRHDPSNPLRITGPIKKQVSDDRQEATAIRILSEKEKGNKKIRLLQEKTNSVIKRLAQHHTILIYYYHQRKRAQRIIKQLAKKLIKK
jgi:HD superfamily phosphohydrolase